MSLTEQRAAYIRPDRQNGERGLVERCQARMIRRKKDTVGAILREFEREIAPLLGPDNGEPIQAFKEFVRRKIGGLAHEGVRLLEAQPGDSFNELAIDLAETMSEDDTED